MAYNIPVFDKFDYRFENHIGELTIFDDDFKIPENVVFTIAGKIPPEGGIEVLQIVMQTDAEYKRYLNSKSFQYDKRFFKKAKEKKVEKK